MNRSRWRIAENPQQCRSCRATIDAGELHVGKMCLICAIPQWNVVHAAKVDYAPWFELYYRELTRAVIASRPQRMTWL